MAVRNNTWYLESFQLTRRNAADWADDYVLAAGAIGLEADTNKTKLGDGATQWKNLAYYSDPILKGLIDALTQNVSGIAERVETLESNYNSLSQRVEVFENITGISVNPAPADSTGE